MTIVHRPGEKHANADALSRLKRKCGSPDCADCNLDPTVNPIIGERLSDDESDDPISVTPIKHVTFATPEVAKVSLIMTRSKTRVHKENASSEEAENILADTTELRNAETILLSQTQIKCQKTMS